MQSLRLSSTHSRNRLRQLLCQFLVGDILEVCGEAIHGGKLRMPFLVSRGVAWVTRQDSGAAGCALLAPRHKTPVLLRRDDDCGGPTATLNNQRFLGPLRGGDGVRWPCFVDRLGNIICTHAMPRFVALDETILRPGPLTVNPGGVPAADGAAATARTSRPFRAHGGSPLRRRSGSRKAAKNSKP